MKKNTRKDPTEIGIQITISERRVAGEGIYFDFSVRNEGKFESGGSVLSLNQALCEVADTIRTNKLS